MSTRRVIFQVHLWTGLASGLYILIIGVSGSLIVFRRELDRALCPGAALCEPHYVTWMAEFHDHLASGRTGLVLNGIGAGVVALMGLTGAWLWWPGRRRVRQALILHRGLSARRFLMELHSVLGMWLLLLLLMWALTGLYFAFPAPFNALVEHWTVNGAENGTSLFWEDAIAALVRLHFGRAFGAAIESLWVLLGLLPGVLFVTGLLMWINRVLRRTASRP